MRRAGRLDAARTCAREAAAALQALIDAGEASLRPTWAEAVALECGIAIDGGRFDGVLACIDAALETLRRHVDPGGGACGGVCNDDGPVRLARSRLHLEAARLHVLRAQPLPAREHAQVAVEAPPLATLEGESGTLIGLRARASDGIAVSMLGDHAAGIKQLEHALTGIEAPGLEAGAADRARFLISLGAMHAHRFQLEAARRQFEQALPLLHQLVRQRRAGAHADMGRALLNIGSINGRANRLAEAQAAYRAALRHIDRGLRSSRLTGDRGRLQATRANASMNLGYVLFRSGDFDAAERWLAAALRGYAPLVRKAPHLRLAVARTRINAAHVAARRDRVERAAALYTGGLQQIESLLASNGAPGLGFDHANALLGVARMALLQGQARRSAVLFERAMTLLRELVQSGQLHHAITWLRAWRAQAALAVEDDRAAPQLARMVPVLVRVLGAPPLRALAEQEDPLRTPGHVLDSVTRWVDIASAREDAHRGPIDVLCAAAVRHLLDDSAAILADSSPAWLAPRQTAVRHWVERMGAEVSRLSAPPLLLAQWFLRTRGLRAQRIALAAAAGDARLEALRSSLQELTRIESSLLGGALDQGSDDVPPAAPSDAPPWDAQRAAQWQALRAQVEAHMAEAVREGVLPPSLQLTAADLATRLRPRQALLFVARVDSRNVVVIALRAEAPSARSWSTTLPPRHDDAPCDLLIAAARQALRHDFDAGPSRDLSPRLDARRRLDLSAAHQAAAGDRLALAALRDIYDHAVAPPLAELIGAGCDDIAIVPADDLHLLPWGELLARSNEGGAAVTVYPSAGAWLRCHESLPPVGAVVVPHWTIADAPTAVTATSLLPWIDIERRLSRRLWDMDGDSGDGAPDALLVIGHGDMPGGNPALSGLRLADGRVLGAHDLAAQGGRTSDDAAQGGFEYVLLSACALGRTDDAFGEPLGFLSASFGYRTRAGIGWLTEVPDDAACLFSLSFQFALRRRLAAGTQVAAWTRAFYETRRAIGEGHWPAGFDAWLTAQATQGEALLPAAPPQTLRRVLPWVIVLGA